MRAVNRRDPDPWRSLPIVRWWCAMFLVVCACTQARERSGTTDAAPAAQDDPTMGSPAHTDAGTGTRNVDAASSIDANADAGAHSSGALGASCASDDHCLAPLTCLAADSAVVAGEGPAGGLCTAPCFDSSQCSAFDGLCVDLGAVGGGDSYCMPKCTVEPPRDALGIDKCLGRSELACMPFAPTGACGPICNSDTDCGVRFCNPGTGLCADTPARGLPIGAECDPAAEPDPCRGFCKEVQRPDGTSTGICYERCVYGAVPSCGWNGERLPAEFGCEIFNAEVIQSGGPGPGDLGYCTRLCDCDAECAVAGVVCVALPMLADVSRYGRRGACAAAGVEMQLPCPP